MLEAMHFRQPKTTNGGYESIIASRGPAKANFIKVVFNVWGRPPHVYCCAAAVLPVQFHANRELTVQEYFTSLRLSLDLLMVRTKFQYV